MQRSFFIQDLNPVDVSRFETVNQDKAAPTVSSKYAFIPTTKVLEVLSDYGWFPTSVSESRTRKAENQGYQKHALRLWNERLNNQLEAKGTLPQILLTNSHSGTAAFTLHVALHEVICRNGLVAEAREATKAYRVHHRGFAVELVERTLTAINEQFPAVLGDVERYRTIELTLREQEAFASAASELRFDDDVSVEPQELLRVRHRAQGEPSIWNTFNVVQENIIRGGVRIRRRDGERLRARPIKAIDADIKLNRALWRLTQELATLKE